MSKPRKPKLPVTDHAVLRWLERFGFIDVEAVRTQIHKETAKALNSGASSVTVNGTEYRIAGGTVVTLINKRANCRSMNWTQADD